MFRFQATLAIAATALSASALAAQESPTLSVEQSEEYGQYIAGPEGKPVYLFTTDTQGDGDEPAISCTSQECLDAWPLVTSDEDVTVGSELDESLAGTFTYEGKTVVTYNGWPLYTYAQDDADEPPQGQDIHSFGGEWYLLGPQGEKVDEEGGGNEAEAADLSLGEAIYESTCRNCHGPKAQGMASFPKLTGHDAGYLVTRLEQYKAGEKVGPNSGLMIPVASDLSDKDIASVAAYIAATFE